MWVSGLPEEHLEPFHEAPCLPSTKGAAVSQTVARDMASPWLDRPIAANSSSAAASPAIKSATLLRAIGQYGCVRSKATTNEDAGAGRSVRLFCLEYCSQQPCRLGAHSL